jgi:hypothetical protein
MSASGCVLGIAATWDAEKGARAMNQWMPSLWRAWSLILVLGTLLAWGVGLSSHASVSPASPQPSPTSPTAEVPKTIVLTSSAFREGDAIPSKYTCTGASTAPPLAWSHVPSRTVSFVLIMEDVSGGGDFTHWVLFNIPPNAQGVTAHVPTAVSWRPGPVRA